jgi:hypothetical protein
LKHKHEIMSSTLHVQSPSRNGSVTPNKARVDYTAAGMNVDNVSDGILVSNEVGACTDEMPSCATRKIRQIGFKESSNTTDNVSDGILVSNEVGQCTDEMQSGVTRKIRQIGFKESSKATENGGHNGVTVNAMTTPMTFKASSTWLKDEYKISFVESLKKTPAVARSSPAVDAAEAKITNLVAAQCAKRLAYSRFVPGCLYAFEKFNVRVGLDVWPAQHGDEKELVDRMHNAYQPKSSKDDMLPQTAGWFGGGPPWPNAVNLEFEMCDEIERVGCVRTICASYIRQ